jgi:hypothetical protein
LNLYAQSSAVSPSWLVGRRRQAARYRKAGDSLD